MGTHWMVFPVPNESVGDDVDGVLRFCSERSRAETRCATGVRLPRGNLQVGVTTECFGGDDSAAGIDRRTFHEAEGECLFSGIRHTTSQEGDAGANAELDRVVASAGEGASAALLPL